MLVADQASPLLIALTIAFVVGLGVLALFFFRGYERLAQGALERRFADIAIHTEPQPGDVVLTYETYHGFIAWFTQTTHRIALPPQDARILLGRLFRFNLTWGLLTWAAIFIPLFAGINYVQQRRSITRQEATGWE